ncbi:GATA zinc finger domain-containing protein 14-like [Zerene cesonia]|uniref:GATA zinc finger domain-containing protein 14-like n=1 Tax=Zerene cesonia TaxID=33412 RepID=UPI0018E55BCA|nr:GATA zinc finger domain-containing protein 14-like [Zerene cesonia]
MEETKASMLEVTKFDKDLFSVVHFIERPHDDIESLVCVPTKWGKKMHGFTYVKYPIEDALQTEIRVRKQEKPSKEWDSYQSVELHVTATYEKAEKFIANRKRRADKKFNKSNVKDTNKLATTMKAQTKEPYITKQKVDKHIEVSKKLQQLFGSDEDFTTTTDVTNKLTQTNFNERCSSSTHIQNQRANCCQEHSGAFSNPCPHHNCCNKPTRVTEGFNIYINGIHVNAFPHIGVNIVPTRNESFSSNYMPVNYMPAVAPNGPAQIPNQYWQNYNHFPSGPSQLQSAIDYGSSVQNQMNQANNSQMQNYASTGQMVSQQVQTNNETTNSQTQTDSSLSPTITEITNNKCSSSTQTEYDSNKSSERVIRSNEGSPSRMPMPSNSNQNTDNYVQSSNIPASNDQTMNNSTSEKGAQIVNSNFTFPSDVTITHYNCVPMTEERKRRNYTYSPHSSNHSTSSQMVSVKAQYDRRYNPVIEQQTQNNSKRVRNAGTQSNNAGQISNANGNAPPPVQHPSQYNPSVPIWQINKQHLQTNRQAIPVQEKFTVQGNVHNTRGYNNTRTNNSLRVSTSVHEHEAIAPPAIQTRNHQTIGDKIYSQIEAQILALDKSVGK